MYYSGTVRLHISDDDHSVYKFTVKYFKASYNKPQTRSCLPKQEKKTENEVVLVVPLIKRYLHFQFLD